MEETIKQARKVVGTKETLKALEKGEARLALIARDAEEKITRPVLELCRQHNVEIRYVDSMHELGKLCGIKVGAAAAAIIEF